MACIVCKYSRKLNSPLLCVYVYAPSGGGVSHKTLTRPGGEGESLGIRKLHQYMVYAADRSWSGWVGEF